MPGRVATIIFKADETVSRAESVSLSQAPRPSTKRVTFGGRRAAAALRTLAARAAEETHRLSFTRSLARLSSQTPTVSSRQPPHILSQDAQLDAFVRPVPVHRQQWSVSLAGHRAWAPVAQPQALAPGSLWLTPLHHLAGLQVFLARAQSIIKWPAKRGRCCCKTSS